MAGMARLGGGEILTDPEVKRNNRRSSALRLGMTGVLLAVAAGFVARLRRRRLPFGNQLDLEYFWPKFAGYEETVVGRVIGDAIQYCFRVGDGAGKQQAGQIDPLQHISVRRRNDGDTVFVPDVGVDFPVDVFELVELIDGGAAVGDVNAADFPKAGGVEEVEFR